MRRGEALALVALLLHACAVSSARLKPGDEPARHYECDRFALEHTPRFWDEWKRGDGGGSGGGPYAAGGALLAFPPVFLLGMAVLVVVLPPLAIAHGIKTANARQESYDLLYGRCMKHALPEPPTPPEAAPESPPPEEAPSPIFSD